MKVKWIEYENIQTGLKIERVNFFSDITLLVGLSGAGKTQILNAVAYSLKLAVSKQKLRPYEVKMCLMIGENEYIWSYKIKEIKRETIFTNNSETYQFIYEKLEKNQECIFEREDNRITVTGYDKVPNPKKDESLILQYSEDDEFQTLIYELKNIYSIDMEIAIRDAIRTQNFIEMRNHMMHYNSKLKYNIGNLAYLPAPFKLYMCKYQHHNIYIKIYETIKELFPEIEDLDVVEDSDKEVYVIAIKVYGKILFQDDISNGMLKSIYYIVELYSMTANSVVLIDEFENGLGVNCIDILSEMLLNERNDLQFIITSHHPKIINGIDRDKWKIIDREREVIKNYDSDFYGIGNSRHDAYYNLINRWEFEGKI